MNALDILSMWAEYTHYDPNKKSFNMLNEEYAIRLCMKNIEKLSEYDPSGILAVIYAKNTFISLLQEKKVSLYQFFANGDDFAETEKMWQAFHSEQVTLLEKEFLDGIHTIVSKVLVQKEIGERDQNAEREALFLSVNAVVEQLTQCHIDVYRHGGKIGNLSTFVTRIVIFDSLASCLTTLESKAEDGIYLCYIDNNGTAEGYFGFFIKSNGTIFSVNEQIKESYPGQHGNCRNASWTEDKKDHLFPYNYIFDFKNFDYKGYATSYSIDSQKLDFCNLNPETYIPLILAMTMLSKKYSGEDFSKNQLVYTDLLLPVNRAITAKEKSLVVMSENSMILKEHECCKVKITTEDILADDKNLFVQLYGKGFHLDSHDLLSVKQGPLFGKKNEEQHEFVGKEDIMKRIAYLQGRKQLANYIRDQMLQEYLNFGKNEGIAKWWNETLIAHKEVILSLIRQKKSALDSGKEKTVDSGSWINCSDSPLCFIDTTETTKGYATGFYVHEQYPFNQQQVDSKHPRGSGKYFCCIDGSMSSIFYVFRFQNWKQIEAVLGPVPKLLKGWQKDGHFIEGNPILNASDPITGIGTPVEERERRANRRLWTKHDWSCPYFACEDYSDSSENTLQPVLAVPPCFYPEFAVGFSKRGFAKMLRGK